MNDCEHSAALQASEHAAQASVCEPQSTKRKRVCGSFHAPRPNPRMSVRVVMCTLLLLVSDRATTASEVALSNDRQRELAQNMVQSFEQAVTTQRSAPDSARDFYQQSVQAGQALEQAGVRSPALQYNLGNAFVRLNDLGRAVLHLRRAVALAPGEDRIQANLRYVRDRVEPAIAQPASNQLMRAVLFFHHDYSPSTRIWAAMLAGLTGWACLFARLWKPRMGLTAVGSAGALTGLLLGCSVLWQLHHDAKTPPAVVLETQTLRLGRGEGHDAALSQPLGPGVELRVLEDRAGWVRVELVDGKTGWLPATAVDRV